MILAFRNIHQDWFSNLRDDALAGAVVALALIPEAIAFSIIAGVDPAALAQTMQIRSAGSTLRRPWAISSSHLTQYP